ncbi:MAG: hypothetical protein WD060_05275 [Pirellulales bacterium]
MRSLLMGGQACVLYGGAEFSRDTDIVIVSDAANLDRLRAAVADLDAHPIEVPPFEQHYLDEGLAVHFRCRAAGVEGMRLDVMSRVRGLPDFETLWNRRTTIDTGEQSIEVLSLPDLVTAKKTQRDKDWPMISRLVEAHWTQTPRPATDAAVDFWLRELRTPSLLMRLACESPAAYRRMAERRKLLDAAIEGHEAEVARLLRDEEDREREADRQYWAPLRRRLEALRREH